jgi:hypothetical protein
MARADRTLPIDADVAQGFLDANKAIFRNPTVAGKSLQMIAKGLNLSPARQFGPGTATIPFTTVPGAMLTEGATWTPIGYLRAMMQTASPLIRGKAVDGRAIADSVIKATIGTGSTVLSGYWLHHLGVLTGAPEQDKELDALRNSLKWGAYRVNLSSLKRRLLSGDWATRESLPAEGDLVMNYNWLEPVAFGVAMGADISRSQDQRLLDLKRGKLASNAMISAAAAGTQSLTGNPMLQGVERFIKDFADRGWAQAAASMAMNIPENFLPSLARQTAQYLDNTVRETRGGTFIDQEANRILAQIPGLSEKYPARYDVTGEAVRRYDYGKNSALNTFFNPAQWNRFAATPALREMFRMYDASVTAPAPNVPRVVQLGNGQTVQIALPAGGSEKALPRQVDRTLEINGQQVQLDNKQIAAYQKYVGQVGGATVARLLASPGFAAEPDGLKQQWIAKIFTAVNEAAKVDLFGQAPTKLQISAAGKPSVSFANPLERIMQINARRQGVNQVPPQP